MDSSSSMCTSTVGMNLEWRGRRQASRNDTGIPITHQVGKATCSKPEVPPVLFLVSWRWEVLAWTPPHYTTNTHLCKTTPPCWHCQRWFHSSRWKKGTAPAHTLSPSKGNLLCTLAKVSQCLGLPAKSLQRHQILHFTQGRETRLQQSLIISENKHVPYHKAQQKSSVLHRNHGRRSTELGAKDQSIFRSLHWKLQALLSPLFTPKATRSLSLHHPFRHTHHPWVIWRWRAMSSTLCIIQQTHVDS